MALMLAYCFICELITGTTPGKLAMGLKVIHLDGSPYRLPSALIRNVLRLVDSLPLFYFVGIASAGMTSARQRVGDLAAGTAVARTVIIRGVARDEGGPVLPLYEAGRLLPSPWDCPTDSSWKRSALPRMGVALLLVTVVSVVGVYLTPPVVPEAVADVPVSQPTIPEDAALRGLAKQTMLAFDRALEMKDFADFHAAMSELWKSQTTPAKLVGIFGEMTASNLSISGIRDTEPVFSAPPAIDADGLLVLSGYMRSGPARVTFELSYIYEHPRWLLAGISVSVR
jgi:hypothetical protein